MHNHQKKIAAINDFFLSIVNNDARKQPVQAPVPGSGIPIEPLLFLSSHARHTAAKHSVIPYP